MDYGCRFLCLCTKPKATYKLFITFLKTIFELYLSTYRLCLNLKNEMYPEQSQRSEIHSLIAKIIMQLF